MTRQASGTPGKCYVADPTKVDRYSYVILGFPVVGELRHDPTRCTPIAPARTWVLLSGARRKWPRYMQLIAYGSDKCRGSYGGGVGYFTAHGDSGHQSCYSPALVGKRYRQRAAACGAGIVLTRFRSPKPTNPHKARAVLRAIATAHHAQETLMADILLLDNTTRFTPNPQIVTDQRWS